MNRIYNYISNWIFLLFTIWMLLYAYDKNNKFIKKFNLYYLNIFIWYGYLGYLFIHLFVKKTQYDWVIIPGLLIHYLPMYVYQNLNIKPNKDSLYLFFLVFLCYLSFIHDVLDKNMTQIYFEDKQIMKFSDWIDIFS